MNRETIYAALFAKASASSSFSETGRRLKHIDDLAPAQFPAFYQVQKDEAWKQPSGNLPPIGELTVEWWVYAYNSDSTNSTAAKLNPLIDALCASVGLPPAMNPSGFQTLGGLVESVRLDGRIDYAEGAMEDRGFARIPLVIRLPG
jgi:hypothetical protein